MVSNVTNINEPNCSESSDNVENLNVEHQSTLRGDTCSWALPHPAGQGGYAPTAAVRDGNQQSSYR